MSTKKTRMSKCSHFYIIRKKKKKRKENHLNIHFSDSQARIDFSLSYFHKRNNVIGNSENHLHMPHSPL